jgi:hypothetical protein
MLGRLIVRGKHYPDGQRIEVLLFAGSVLSDEEAPACRIGQIMDKVQVCFGSYRNDVGNISLPVATL